MLERRTREETVAIFDDIISQMEGDSQGTPPRQGVSPLRQQKSHSTDLLDHGLQNEDETQIQSNSGSGPAGMELGPSILARRVKSSDVPQGGRVPIRRTSSSTSLDKGGEGPVEDHAHPPRAASVETDLVFATLPKKKKGHGRWSGFRRIGSPFSKSRRKSFTSGTTPSYAHTNHTSGLVRHTAITGPSPSVPVLVEHEDIGGHAPLSERNRMHDVSRTSLPTNPTTMSGLGNKFSADDSHAPSSSSSQQGGRGRRGEGLGIGRRGGLDMGETTPIMERKRSVSAPRDECLNALKVMTTLSSNQECLGSLISYICLPKCVSK